MRFLIAPLTAILVALFATSAIAQERYIKLVSDQVPIRFAPSSTAQLVATGRKGDVFRLSADKAGWFEIYMFSGEARFIAKVAAQVAQYKVLLPDSLTRRQEIYRALGKAEDRSFADADRKYQPSMVDKNIEHQRILDDTYKLEVMHQFNVQPPIYRPLNLEGAKARWR
jgi:hypothetical protein